MDRGGHCKREGREGGGERAKSTMKINHEEREGHEEKGVDSRPAMSGLHGLHALHGEFLASRCAPWLEKGGRRHGGVRPPFCAGYSPRIFGERKPFEIKTTPTLLKPAAFSAEPRGPKDSHAAFGECGEILSRSVAKGPHSGAKAARREK
jgi:hypothetical protein